MKLITIRQGERVAVWDKSGRMRVVDGPRRVFLFRQTAQRLQLFSAEASQYLAVRYCDGHCQNVRGPASIFWDPVLHEKITVEEALAINAHEAVVVYAREDGKVLRRVVHGPAVFVPSEKEWLHEFSWHGADPRNPHRKVPHGLKFRTLWTIPDQMYFDVPEVRTADDALLVIELMIFFELADIERMLDQTHDPIADFVNAVSADVIDYVGRRTFEEFKSQTEKLNDLSAYANLTQRATRIGYRISKVVYRGYLAGEKLQAMHDAAIQARTKLKLEAETERQAQELADLRLAREAARADQQRQMEQAQAQHRIALERLGHDEKLRARTQEQENEAAATQRLNAIDLEHRKAADAQRVDLLRAMQALQVDLTKYLVAQYQNPDRLIRVEGEKRTQLHLHEN
ncbi:MAG: hypothetical protein ABFD92_02430 [Planctomycetaceae bacterium]|nr:hypothetical protein [Planctomycetaceae bacterium]